LGFGVWGLGFRVWCAGMRVYRHEVEEVAVGRGEHVERGPSY
jgi:glycyl-tRNA synthetase alpha subunit